MFLILSLVLILQKSAMLPRIPDKPYEAKFEHICLRNLPGGEVASTSKTGVVARDSNGREVEQEHILSSSGGQAFGIAKIYDPVGARSYILDRLSKTILNMSPISGGMGMTVDVGDTAVVLPIGRMPEGGSRMGRQVIEGQICTGYRQSIVNGTLEYWVSDELQALILIRTASEDRKTTYRIYDIRRREPDTGLFSIPEDYRVWK